MRRRLPTVVGAVVFVVAVGFCIGTFARERARVGDALADARPVFLLAAVGSAAAAMVVVALGWRRCLAALGAPLPRRLVARWYFVGELGKYVPGGIWPIVGRGELARRGGVARGVAYQSVVWSLASWYGAALLPLAAVLGHPRVQAVTATVSANPSGSPLRATNTASRTPAPAGTGTARNPTTHATTAMAGARHPCGPEYAATTAAVVPAVRSQLGT